MSKQTTIKKEVSVQGVGLHTGKESKIVFKPARADEGIVFVRVDLPNKPHIKAVVKNTLASQAVRGSVIANGDATVYTIEHIMASVSALGIDNLIIEIDSAEPPILDGSALGFAGVLDEAQVTELEAAKKYLTLAQPISVSFGVSRYWAYPCDHFEIDATIGFDHPLLKMQHLAIPEINRDVFLKEIAPAKTFCFDYEIESLLANNLGKGGNMSNAIVIGLDGIHNEEPLRFKDEFVRHKILDLIGDLYLAGHSIKAQVVVDKPGHKNNIHFVEELLKKAVLV
ncbi:MAG: UDP-3-O-acyl-N-acetylglucosamine deacetylase [Elusimicrobiota bacterium]|nr:UDP-3-O-acyl-N-acetylglucosamine deacetylase [Elusimicrobiota bacterium]